MRSGRVRVNGNVCRDAERSVHPENDRIEVDGSPITAQEKIYLMMNKPRGLVTTASDEKGRDTVYSLLSETNSWLAPVGRLDKASEGLLVFTNDSAWSARVLAPESHLDKTYHVQVGVVADEKLLDGLMQGVQTDAGDFLKAKSARLLRSGQKNSWIEIVLDEGKNRHIRRMLEHFGVEVLRLVRTAIGPLQLGELTKGSSRALALEEKEAIDRALLILRRPEGSWP